MDKWEKLLASSLRTKVLVPVIAVMVALLVATVLIVNGRFQQQMEENSRQQFAAAKVLFQQSQTRHRLYLQRRFQSLAREPMYHAAFRPLEGHPHIPTVRDQLERMYKDENLAAEDISFIFFTPAETNLSNAATALVQKINLKTSPASLREECRLVVAKTLTGETAFDTVRIKNLLFNIISIPIEDGGQIIGALTFGENFAWNAAQEFSVSSGADGSVLLAGDQVIASAMPTNSLDNSRLLYLFKYRSHSKDENETLVDTVEIGGSHYFYAGGNLPSLIHDTSIGYLLFNNYDDQLSALRGTRELLTLVSLAGILIGTVVVWFFIYYTMQPLTELRAGAEAVGRGDFSKRVAVRSRDECGELAKAFNRMTQDVEYSQSQLKQTVETLKTTQGQLIQSEKLSAVGEFIAGVAHELNNPLATVMGFSEILKDAPVEPKYQRHLQMVFKSAERCQKIVQSLLTFARRRQPERKLISLNKIIADVLDIVSYQLRTNNIQVQTELAPELPCIVGDEHQIQQVILNLINNARQAIEAHQPTGQITVTTRHTGKFVRLAITDNGPGIAAENISKIFDPFFTTKGVGKGTGLGLSLCYGLIHEHHGSITVASEPGSGATFKIELPVAENIAEHFQATTETPTTTFQKANPDEGQGKTIYVIDDEEMLLQLVYEELTANGYTVFTCNNGEMALRELRLKKVDAVLCDIKMPGLNGQQVYERLREEQPELARHFAFVTGDLIGENLATFFAEENVGYLSKPFSLAELRETVRHLVK